MGISNKFSWPEDENDFEAMCHVLYNKIHSPDILSRVGRKGQAQFGIDILGVVKGRSYGIQCKYFTSTKFTLDTVKSDIRKAENEPTLKLGHLHFVTTAPSDSKVVKEVVNLSLQRQQEGKFTISVEYWDDICGHIRVYPEVGQEFIPEFPGGRLIRMEKTLDSLAELQKGEAENRARSTETLNNIQNTNQEILASFQQFLSSARGDEVDAHLTSSLDFVRDNLRQGKTKVAKELLDSLGSPDAFKDEYSKFRWKTNNAFIHLLEGRYPEAAKGFLEAFDFAKGDEKALVNRTHAYILKKEFEKAEQSCKEGLEKYPESSLLWGLKVHILTETGKSIEGLEIPDKVRESSDVLYALAHERSTRNLYEEAIKFIKECLGKDSNSLNVKRAFLADTLAWCSQDTLAAFHGQLTAVQSATLREALSYFEPLETYLPSIQSDHLSAEITNNAVFALILLNEAERAYHLADILLVRHPLHEGLLRIKLQSLDEKKDISAIHALVDHRLKELPLQILCILSEISATSGQPNWNEQLRALLNTYELDSFRKELLAIYHAQSHWLAGNAAKALELINEYTSANPKSVLTHILHSRVLESMGFLEESKDSAILAFKLIEADSKPIEILQTADLLYHLDKYQDAGLLYQRLLTVVGDNEITLKRLVCLIETDQRSKAQTLVEQITKEGIDSTQFRRIKINFYRRTGDWNKMLELLEQELKAHPTNISVALGYAGVLYRLDRAQELKTYLETNPVFKNASLEDEFEFAKFQSHNGLTGFALSRMYKLYRSRPADSRAANYFLTIILLGDSGSFLNSSNCVTPGSAVRISNEAETRTIAIDFEHHDSVAWPELVSPKSEVAKKLLGLKENDKVELQDSFVSREFSVQAIESLYSYISRLAHDQISKTVDSTGPLYSVQIIKKDGQPDVDLLIKSAADRRKEVERIFGLYKKHKIPISMVARSIGTDLVTLFLEWPKEAGDLFVGQGTHSERETAINIVQGKQHRYVLDLTAVAEFAKYKCFGTVLELLGRPLIPATAKGELQSLIQMFSNNGSTSSLSEDNGKLILQDTPPQYYEERVQLLKEMIGILDQCEVVPTLGPADVPEELVVLANAIDGASLDSIYLSLEREAVLVTEDGSIQILSKGAGVVNSIGIQPILWVAYDKKLMNLSEYTNILINKFARSHSFISVRSQEMLEIATRTPSVFSQDIRLILNTFKLPTIDLPSAIGVCAEFLQAIFTKVDINIVALYYQEVLNALLENRSLYSRSIKSTFAALLTNSISTKGNKLKKSEIRMLREMLPADNDLERLVQERLVPLIRHHRDQYFPMYGMRYMLR